MHEKAAVLLHSVARNHALVDGNERTAWLAMRVFLRFNGVTAGTAPPPRRPPPSPARSSRRSPRTSSTYRLPPSASRPGFPFPDRERTPGRRHVGGGPGPGCCQLRVQRWLLPPEQE
ncbi:Fic family protein [Streptomyces griseosporeus]|uniref:Fic family protein n=1 Tax=Streptomyces griseosporeus TaxID=1910 RepID=UPI0036FC1F90